MRDAQHCGADPSLPGAQYGQGIALLRLGHTAAGRADIAAATAGTAGVAERFARWGVPP